MEAYLSVINHLFSLFFSSDFHCQCARMVNVCYICGTHHKLPLFRFPKRRRQEWEQILMIPLHSRGKIYRFLCADHFLSSDVINGKHIVLRYFRHNYYWFHPPPSQAVIKLIQYKWISLCENDEQSQPWFII